MKRFIDRFWDKVAIGKDDECWPWLGGLCSHGHGRCYTKKNSGKPERAYAHRIAFYLVRGDIPNQLPLDHLCSNPPCCNPDHLDPVTNSENVLRGHHRRFLASVSHLT